MNHYLHFALIQLSHSESTKAINHDVRLLVVGYILIIVWAVIALNRNSWWVHAWHLLWLNLSCVYNFME